MESQWRDIKTLELVVVLKLFKMMCDIDVPQPSDSLEHDNPSHYGSVMITDPEISDSSTLSGGHPSPNPFKKTS